MLRDYLNRLMASLTGSSTGGSSPPAVEQYRLRGFAVSVINERPDIATADALARLDEALGLIGRYAPRRLRRLLHDVAEIWVRRFPCRAAFYPEPRACLIELTFLVNPRHSAAEVAASLVHEGVHARVARCGAVVRPDGKAREERLCRQAELEFGLAIAGVPGSDVVLDRARQSLLLADQEVAPDIDWEVAARRVAEADGRSTWVVRGVYRELARPESRNLAFETRFFHGPHPVELFAWHRQQRYYPAERILTIYRCPRELRIACVDCAIAGDSTPVHHTGGRVEIGWRRLPHPVMPGE